MAPIKFEENIKDKLEKRTLSPLSESWSKLSERLDADDNSSKKPIFWWLSIAAGLLIMIAISVQFFTQNESEKVMPNVVEEPLIKEQINEKISESNAEKTNQLANEENGVEDKEEALPIINESKIIDYKNATTKKSELKTQLANQNTSVNKNTDIKQEDLLNKEVQDLLDEAQINNAIAEAKKTLKSENTSVTDQEIDSLLKIASKELFKEKLNLQTIKTVDANALLISVEDEMGQSFRTKVFEALKESYETVKTAVADRNN